MIMKFKKSLFGFIDMIKFSQLTKNRSKHLSSGENKDVNVDFKVNKLAHSLHPLYMQAELVKINKLNSTIKEFVFRRIDDSKFPFFKAGQYVSLQTKIGESLVSRPYSIVSSPEEALDNILRIAIQKSGFFSTYMFEKAKVGDKFVISEPSGDFTYSRIRDKKNIICIAGGSGITPFVSMAHAIVDKNEDCKMTLFYGCRTLSSACYIDELNKLVGANFKLVVVTSDEENKGCEHGFVTSELLEKYSYVKNSTIFCCGPENLYKFIKKELSKYELPLKQIHIEESCCPNLKLTDPKKFTLTVHMEGDVYKIDCLENETLLTSLERAGINAPNRCRGGVCGWCHSYLIKGQVKIAAEKDHRREADKSFNYIHLCITYPLSDVEIEVPKAY